MRKLLFYGIAGENFLTTFPIEQSAFSANAGGSTSGLGVETIPA